MESRHVWAYLHTGHQQIWPKKRMKQLMRLAVLVWAEGRWRHKVWVEASQSRMLDCLLVWVLV